MKRNRQVFHLFLGLVLATAATAAADAPDARRADGAPQALSTRVGSATVSAAAVAPGVLRLSIRLGGPAAPYPTIFVDPAHAPAPAFRTIHDDSGKVGVADDDGQLLIDPARATWELRDSAGRVLVAPSPLPDKTYPDQKTHERSIALESDFPAGAAPLLYGSGNGAKELEQKQGRSNVGNGRAIVPHFWSTAGYTALAASSNDILPPAWVSDAQRVTWRTPGDGVDLYLMPAANLAAAAKAYATISGPPLVPPRWTFGYLQSRWGWKDRAYIEDTLQQFRNRKLPVDAFIFDFEWYTPTPDYALKPTGAEDFKDFSFNPPLFPDPAAQIAAMHAAGVHFVGIRKPRVGNAALLREFHQKGWILPPGREGIDARCLDFANPQVRDWYAQQLQPLLQAGVDGWWDDEGELTYTTYYWWNAAERQALDEIHPEQRLWTIDRAFQPGVQRLGPAAWTGDIASNWPTLQRTPTDLLNWSLAGMSYGACDIGGFKGQDSPQLLTRWMQAGALFPVMRSHSSHELTPRFPWLYGPQAESAIRSTLQLRYQLIPLLYSLSHVAHDTGMPIMRPLLMEFPDDPQAANLSDEWLLGDRLLAAPVLTEQNTRSVYLPADTWYRFGSTGSESGGQTVQTEAALDQIPLYVRAGTILPLAPDTLLHTNDLPGGPLQVQVYPGHDATFTLVEDDGNTTGYLHGQTRRTTFTWDDHAGTLKWTVQGPYAGKDIFTAISARLMQPGTQPTPVSPLGTGGAINLRQ